MTRAYRLADLFCGAGGFSTGASRSIQEMGGAMQLTAVNHWPVAVATHSANHPEARHITANLATADPLDLVPEGELDLLLASPECRYYSRANGGRATQDQGRMNPWIIHDWLTKLDIPKVIIENVSEFTDWGPLDKNGRPDKAKAGLYFQAWFLTFANLGYQAQWRMLTAADYGDPTLRTRCFIIARKDGAPITWPEPTHAAPKGDCQSEIWDKRRPWRTAAEIIDWRLPGQSIFHSLHYRKKPLKPNTIKRIAHGIRKHNPGLAPFYLPLLEPQKDVAPAESFPHNPPSPKPFIVQYNGTSNTQPVDVPLSTVTTIRKHGLVVPTLPQSAALDSRETPDIHYRMLTNPELASAMGFHNGDFEYRFTGNDADITRQIGNAVPVHLAAALVRSVLSAGES